MRRLARVPARVASSRRAAQTTVRWCRPQHMLLNTNPWLLGVTFIVSTLHSIFDFLAFKNGSSPNEIDLAGPLG